MATKTLLGILIAGAAGIVIFLFVHLSSSPSGGVQLGSKSASACTKGEPDCLPIVNYVDTQGVAYTPQSLTNKVVVVNFWATWCHPCEAEIPDLSKVYESYKGKDVVFLGVLTNDDPSDGKLLNFASDHEMTYPIVRASSDILNSYGYPSGLPTTFVYSKGGKRVFQRVGGVREDEMRRLIDQLVAEK